MQNEIGLFALGFICGAASLQLRLDVLAARRERINRHIDEWLAADRPAAVKLPNTGPKCDTETTRLSDVRRGAATRGAF